MKKIYLIILTLAFNLNYAQERTLDETKTYITKMINDHGSTGNFTKKRLRAEFEGDYLRVVTLNKNSNAPVDKGVVYNFGNVYRFKGPIREPGDIAELIIWVDYLTSEKRGSWDKGDLQFWIDSHELADQMLIAFRHLNKLLMEKKPAVEKF